MYLDLTLGIMKPFELSDQRLLLRDALQAPSGRRQRDLRAVRVAQSLGEASGRCTGINPKISTQRACSDWLGDEEGAAPLSGNRCLLTLSPPTGIIQVRTNGEREISGLLWTASLILTLL